VFNSRSKPQDAASITHPCGLFKHGNAEEPEHQLTLELEIVPDPGPLVHLPDGLLAEAGMADGMHSRVGVGVAVGVREEVEDEQDAAGLEALGEAAGGQ